MFVSDGARELLRAERQQRFADHYISPMLDEARAIGLSPEDVVDLIRTTSSATTDHSQLKEKA